MQLTNGNISTSLTNLAFRVCALTLIFLAAVLGCDTGMSVPGMPNGPADGGVSGGEVADSLAQLGVDTNETARVDDSGDALPDDFSPLGSTRTAGQTDELFIAGMQLRLTDPTGTEEVLPNRSGFAELTNDATAELELSLELFDTGRPWEADTLSPQPSFNGFGGQVAQSATAGDIDGDGRDEILIAYFAESAAAGTRRIFVDIVRAATDSEPETQTVGDFPGVEAIAAVAADFDGDGDDDLAIAVCTDTTAEILFLMNTDATLAPADDLTLSLERLTDSTLTFVELAAGNLDRDNGVELVAVLNEYGGNSSGEANYTIFDDAKTQFAALGAGTVQGRDGQVYTAIVADVALGDIDADGRDEIIFAGLTEFHNDGCNSYGHIQIALDDASDKENPFADLGARYIDDTYVQSGTGCNQNSHKIRARMLHVNAFDVDGDGIDEIQAGRRIFEDWTNASPWTIAGTDEMPLMIPHDAFLKETNPNDGGVISNATSVVVTGDVTGDGREDLITYFQWRDQIDVWGLTGPDSNTATWGLIQTMNTQFYNGQTRVFPIIVPCNVDSDGLALRYSDGEYRLVFTEPIIIAALAAAPCNAAIQQNFDACRTAYGTSEAQQGGIDGTVSVRASTFVGAQVNLFGFGADVRSTVTQTASFSASHAYELEQTVEYTTGPMEDTVIFTTLPIDQYTYTVTSHPDPAMIGEKLVVNMPRTPVTLQVEREFYNASTPADAFKVGSNVFLHTPGDITSYPTEGDADALIDTGGLGHLGPLGELVDAAGAALGPIAERLLGRGLKSSRSVGVGATNGGESSIEIAFSEGTDYRAGAEVDYELSAETTVPGAVIGGSVGGSVEAGLSWGSSNSTIYRGTVGDIAPDSFGGNGYSYGLFTYIYNYGDRTQQQFEVVNYWVE